MDYSLLLIIFNRKRKEDDLTSMRSQGMNSLRKSRRLESKIRSSDFSYINLKRCASDAKINDLQRQTILRKANYSTKSKSSMNVTDSETGSARDGMRPLI